MSLKFFYLPFLLQFIISDTKTPRTSQEQAQTVMNHKSLLSDGQVFRNIHGRLLPPTYTIVYVDFWFPQPNSLNQRTFRYNLTEGTPGNYNKVGQLIIVQLDGVTNNDVSYYFTNDTGVPYTEGTFDYSGQRQMQVYFGPVNTHGNKEFYIQNGSKILQIPQSDPIDQIEEQAILKSVSATVDTVTKVVKVLSSFSLSSFFLSLMNYLSVLSFYAFSLSTVPVKVHYFLIKVLEGTTSEAISTQSIQQQWSLSIQNLSQRYTKYNFSFNYPLYMLEPVVIFVVFELLRRFFRWITNHKLTKSSYYEYVASTLIMLGPNIIFGSWAVIRKRSAFLTFWDKLFYAFYLKILLLYLIALFYYIVMLYNWRKKKSRKNMYMNMEQGKKYVHIQVFLDLLFVLGILLMVDLHFYTFWGFNLLILILILFFHIKQDYFQYKVFKVIKIVTKVGILCHHVMFLIYDFQLIQDPEIKDIVYSSHIYTLIGIGSIEFLVSLYFIIQQIISYVKHCCKSNKVSNEDAQPSKSEKEQNKKATKSSTERAKKRKKPQNQLSQASQNKTSAIKKKFDLNITQIDHIQEQKNNEENIGSKNKNAINPYSYEKPFAFFIPGNVTDKEKYKTQMKEKMKKQEMKKRADNNNSIIKDIQDED